MTTITADDIRKVNEAQFGDEAVLVIVNGETDVMPSSTANEDGDVERIVTTATDVHVYCDGDLNDALATQLAADLTRDLAENIR